MNNDNNTGKVYLVGAGPGDPGLMTQRGTQLLEAAEVVVHDRLIGDDIKAMIPGSAERIDVGKYAGNHPFPQEEISRILVDKAKEGKMVVRLKGGDPFIFGRGGEELELLSEEGIEFEVVPGITAASAATAYAGIPVTHRDYCSSLHFITGHAQAGKELDIDFNALAELDGTLVFYMSVSTAGMIAEGLLGTGMDPDMPTAIVENGTRSDQRTFVQPLSELAGAVDKNEIVSPALIIVGRVCQLSEQFAWFDKLPLKGKHFLVTRPEAGASRLAEGLRQLGAKATVRPAIKTSPIRPIEIPGDPAGFDTVVFTSAAGVESFCDWLLEEGMDMRWFAGKKIACIGSATASALKGYGIAADFVPGTFSGQALGEEMVESGFVDGGSKVLLLRTDIASEDVTDVLTEARVAFADIAVYRTELLEYPEEDAEDYDVVTFTSRSCVEGYVGSTGEAGTAGSMGKAGTAGSAGETGHAGSAGETGHAGSAGETGHVGSAGETGHVGSAGETGHAGSAGKAGTAGSMGKAGHAGSTNGAGSAGAKALCIGKKTAEAAREHGFDVTVSDEATIGSMLEKAVEQYGR